MSINKKNPRWTQRPPRSTWGDWGADDQLGRLNLLTPERVKAAVAEVREGKVFCLSLPLDRPGGNVLNPRRQAPQLMPTGPAERPRYNQLLCEEHAAHTDVVCDDQVKIALQYSTQWDALAHVGALFDTDGDGVPEPVYYNGFRAHVDIRGPHEGAMQGATRLGIENMAEQGIQGRGVLIDLHSMYGNERKLVGYEELMAVIERDTIEIERGDIVCLHTGFSKLIMEMDGKPDADILANSCAVLDARDERLQQWLVDSNIAALAADNYAVEALPARPSTDKNHPSMPLHHLCLFELGLPLGELWWLSDLAAWLRSASRTRFLLTAPPLRLPGAVGSPVTPIATV